MKKTKDVIVGEILTDEIYYSLKEFCEVCGVHAEVVIELIEYGIIEPKGKTTTNWQFTARQLQRSKRALRLQHDLQINLPGVALSLDLLDQVDDLLARIDRLEKQAKWLNKE